MRNLMLAAVALCLIACVAPAYAVVYDANADWTPNANPNGAWSYGWAANLNTGYAFSQYDSFVANYVEAPSISGINSWRNSGAPNDYNCPKVDFNPTDSDQTNYVYGSSAGSYYRAKKIAIHPGIQGQLSIVRWTAAGAGVCKLNATFYTAYQSVWYWDYGNTSSDMTILHNGGQLWYDSFVGWPGQISPPELAFSVSAGDTVDIAVGWGSNQGPWGDLTGLDAVIDFAPVPEPASLVTLSGLMAGIGLSMLRRRARA